MSERIVVLGAGYAGLLAAVRVDKRARGRAEVVLVNADDGFVERIRLHQRATGQRLQARAVAEFLDGTGVRFVRGRVQAIDAAARRVDVDGAALPYDRLVIALGSGVDADAVPGVRAHAFTLDAASAAALERELPSLAAARARLVVVGGGATGIETAAELAERFPSLRTTLVTAGALGAGLSPRAAEYLGAALGRLGVDVVEAAPVRAVEAGGLRLDDGTRAADAVVWAGGFVAPPLLRAAGLAVGARGQALVDATLRSVSHPEVWVAGDAAAPVAPVGAPIHMGCKTAMPMGAHVADNLARALDGAPLVPFDFGDPGVCISLGRRDGLVEPRRHRDGAPSGRLYTGRTAAFIKEQVSRYTLWMLRLERRAGWRYRWYASGARAVAAGAAGRVAA